MRIRMRSPDISFGIEKYNLTFPAIPAALAVLLYFNWVGLTMPQLPGHPVLRAFVLAGHVLLFPMMINYYPTIELGSRNRTAGRTQEFLLTGQGYFEAAAIAILGWTLNWIPCHPAIKYSVFLCALPAIHFSLAKRFKLESPQPLHYPDVGRPFVPDE